MRAPHWNSGKSSLRSDFGHLCTLCEIAALEKIMFESVLDGIVSKYKTRSPANSLRLRSANINVKQKALTVNVRASFVFRWAPILHVEAVFRQTPPVYMDMGDATITYGSQIIPVYIFAVWHVGSQTTIKMRLQSTVDFDSHIDLDAVLFHVPNFKEYAGYAIKEGDTMFHGRALLKAKNYRVILDSVSYIGELEKKFYRKAGHAITHVGLFHHTDQTKVSVREFLNNQETLSAFFSFVRGFSIKVLLPMGYVGDNSVAEVWNQPTAMRSYTPVSSWYSATIDAEHLASCFENFVRVYESPQWHDPLAVSLDFYCNSNQRLSEYETGIVSNQTVFETLTWVLFVEQLQLYSPQDYGNSKKHPAESKLMELLNHCKITTNIPNELSALQTLAATIGFANAPQALVRIRNKFVHPKDAKFAAQLTEDAKKEAWSLSLHFVELTILKMVGYSGPYFNRIRKKTETTPWP